MQAATLRHRLRAETNAVHEQLHQQQHFAAIADGTIADRDFAWLMTRMGAFYRAFDPAIEATLMQTGPAAGGYVYHARLPLFRQADASVPSLPEMPDLAAVAGAVYVVDGSVLGGQILGRAIGDRLSHPYWDWCADSGAKVWRSTRALIDRADTCTASADRAVATAQAVFQAFSDHMNDANVGAVA